MHIHRIGRRREALLFGAAMAGLSLAAGRAHAASVTGDPNSGTYNEGDSVTVTVNYSNSNPYIFIDGSTGTMNWTGLPGDHSESMSVPNSGSHSGSSSHTVTLAQDGTATWNATGSLREYNEGSQTSQPFDISGSFTVNNVAPTIANAYLNGNDGDLINLPEGSNISMYANATDPGEDVLTFTIRGINAGNGFSVTSGTRTSDTVYAQFDDEGLYLVQFEVNDGDDSTYLVRNVDVDNQPPSFLTTQDNGAVDFNVSPLFNFFVNGTDPGIDDVLSYNWDFDGDGEYDDFTGQTGDFDFSTLPGVANGVLNLGVRLDDGDGGAVVHNFQVELSNVPIPEPGALALLAGAVPLAAGRSRRRSFL